MTDDNRISRRVTVEYSINESGCPVVTTAHGACLAAVSVPPSEEIPLPQMILEGNRAGLRTLAAWLVAMADDESVADHQHFDNETNMGLFRSHPPCELIIQRLEK